MSGRDRSWQPGEPIWTPLSDAVTKLTFEGYPDAPAEALRRLCEAEWVALGSWEYDVWQGEEFSTELYGGIEAGDWEHLKVALARGLEEGGESGKPLPRFAAPSLFRREKAVRNFPRSEMAAWRWRENQFEFAISMERQAEQRFVAREIIVTPAITHWTPPALFRQLEASTPVAGRSPTPTGGRPPTCDWVAAALAMSGRFYLGELKPKTIADVVRALQEWASESGIDLADATAKPHAKRIFDAFRAWEAD